MTGTGGPIRVAVLGATGSIGISALKVIRRHPDRFRVTVLTANRSVDTLARQAHEHAPACVVVSDDGAFSSCEENGTAWVGGRDALIDAVRRPDVDVVLNGLVGFAGLEPSLAALEAGKRLALANKESLVTAGELMLRALARGGGSLVPIDSEHSAILQCVEGRPRSSIARLVLTASGGPFREWAGERLRHVRPADALNHPTWDMGAKISVDSATLANKAMEVIEGHFLFGVPYEKIEVVVHPQSIVHSFVEFVDGSVVAQLGFPTMELPILYALTHPGRVDDPELRTFDPVRFPPLTFEEPDHERFPLLRLGYEAGRSGGTAPVTFNAANEVAVSAFLAGEISFAGMIDVVVQTLGRSPHRGVTDLSDVLEADREARNVARGIAAGMGSVA
ncbi:MAG: 1-deoxy-D-xylulose-5-phosphate reductoisomerase [Gemmatimonadetes bacterium]|nr:1-deoxy-D-xylulose-5-phosphate reductoisomerase [Gemmatimonadota bacterium]